MASLHFYKYYLRYNGNVTDYDFVDLIDNIWNNHTPQQRTINIKDRWYSMSAYWHPVQNDQTVRYFWIDKSFTNNPWTGNLGTDDRKLVPGTLYQNASCLLIPNSHTLVVYEPQNSPTSNELSRYFESFITPTIETDTLDIVLRSVTSDLTFDQINRNCEVKSFTIDVNPDEFDPDLAFPNYGVNPISGEIIAGLTSVSNATRDASDGSDTPTVGIKIRKRQYKDPVNHMLMAYLRGDIDRDGTGIVDINVTIRRPNHDKDEIIKLSKTSNLLQSYELPENITGHEAIFNDLDNKYNNHEFPRLALDIVGLPPLEEFEDACIEYVANPDNMVTGRILEEHDENKQFGDAG